MNITSVSSDDKEYKLEHLESILDELHRKETKLVRKKISVLKKLTKWNEELNCIKETLIRNKIKQLHLHKDMMKYKSQQH